MMQRNTSTQRARRRASGFTLVEILISLGIFLIGMTAIVSLFPAAAILQRETTQEVLANMAAESGKAIIDAQGLTYGPGATPTGDLRFYHNNAGTNETDSIPLRVAMGDQSGVNKFGQLFPFTDRSFPTGLVDNTTANAFDAIKQCDLHWVPFIQDLNGDRTGPNWIVRLFIVESDSRANYPTGAVANVNQANPEDPNNFPKVLGVNATVAGSVFTIPAGTGIEASDILMDSNGNDHVVIEVNPAGTQITVLFPIPQFPAIPTKVWYAPRGGAPNSPAQRVITLEVNVQAP